MDGLLVRTLHSTTESGITVKLDTSLKGQRRDIVQSSPSGCLMHQRAKVSFYNTNCLS